MSSRQGASGRSVARAVRNLPPSIATTGGLLVLTSLVVAPFLVKSYVVFQSTIVLVYAIGVLSLNVLTGASGQLSLGHSAFFAIGAYTTGILMTHGSVSYSIAIVAAGAICSVFGFLFGLPALRLKGLYLALATFALALAVPPLLKFGAFEPWTAGVQGLVVTKPNAPFDLKIGQDRWLYYLVLAVALIAYWLSVNILGSRTGRAFLAIRDHEIAASAVGVNVALYKTLAFGISAGMAGVAGALSAIVTGFISPDAYTFNVSILLFIGMVVGGVGWLPGSLVGAAFVVLMPNIAEGVAQGLSGLMFGVFILIMIFVLPDGAKQLIDYVRGSRSLSPDLRWR